MKSALAANAIAKAASASLTIGAAGVVGVLGVVIPLRIVGAMSPSSAGAAESSDIVPADPDRAAVQAGLKQLIESAGALVAVHDGERPHAVFWRGDEQDAGIVNDDELFVLAHHRLLETIVAYSWEKEEGDEGSGRVSTDHLFSDELFSTWRRSPQVQGTVVAAGTPDVRLSWRDSGEGAGELTVRLIWGHGTADDDGERPTAEERTSVFTARVPALRRVR